MCQTLQKFNSRCSPIDTLTGNETKGIRLLPIGPGTRGAERKASWEADGVLLAIGEV